MKRLFISISIYLMAVLSFGQDITDGNNKFALNLLQKLANGSENCFYSPYSISTALFMTASGAKSETEKQMLEVLCQPENSAAYHKKFGEHLSLVERKSKIQLKIANSIWLQKDQQVQQSFIDLLDKQYQAKLNKCDFKTNADAEAKNINSWVAKKTENKIKELIKPGILNASTKMVLVNAIYFYGEWDKEFKKENTREDNFYKANGTISKAKFMNAAYEMNYTEVDDFQVLAIPYQKNEASMMVFLPKSKQNFEKYLYKLTCDKFSSLIAGMRTYQVNLTFPKYTMTAEFELKKVLSEMGMPLPFSDNADFSGMTGKKDLKIDKVIHKAFVDVSEKGTEAAASTAVIMKRVGAVPGKNKTIYFKADHPFVFMIRDNATGQILFVGVVNSPWK